MPQVKIPPPYRGPTQGKAVVEVAGDTVRACVEAVDAAYPGIGELVFDASGAQQAFVTLFVNGDELARDAVDTVIGEDDEVEILAAVAGG